MRSIPIRVVSGDVGGTKTRLAVVAVDGANLHIEQEHTFASGDYPEFGEVLGQFLRDIDVPTSASFGIAGPVRGRVAQATNLPWRVDADELERKFGFSACSLLNDLEATAWGLQALGTSDLLSLHEGSPGICGNAAVIAPGTGLGEAGLYWDGSRYHPFATEGGHASFSPGNERDTALLLHLQKAYGHVSWERILSGPGLVSLHKFNCAYHRATMPDWLQLQMQHGDGAAAVANAAMQGRDELCVDTLDWFVRLFGAEAGNLALKVMAKGGLFLGGGIPPRIVKTLQGGTFLEGFFSKGRMRPLLESMPVQLILNDRAALYGPAVYASRLHA